MQTICSHQVKVYTLHWKSTSPRGFGSWPDMAKTKRKAPAAGPLAGKAVALLPPALGARTGERAAPAADSDDDGPPEERGIKELK